MLEDIQNPKTREQLYAALAKIQAVPNINRGGCGIAALALYRWARARGIWTDSRGFVFLWEEGDEWEADRNDQRLLDGQISQAVAPNHVVLRLYDGLYDSDGPYDVEQAGDIPQLYELDEAELVCVLNNTGALWNDEFDREDITLIETALGVSLADVKQF